MFRIKNIPIFLAYITLITLSFSQLKSTFNSPFINSEETVKIKQGMIKSSVLNTIGSPLFVKYGDLTTKQEIWVYEVRTILVLSDLVKNQPRKSFEMTKHSKDTHLLQVIFINGEVSSWGPYVNSEETLDKESQVLDKQEKSISDSSDLHAEKSKKSNKFSIGAIIGIVEPERFSSSEIAFGGHFGFGSYGLELITHDGDNFLLSIMLTKVNSRGKLNIHTGFGYANVEDSYSYGYWDEYYDYESYSGAILRLGVGYPISLGKITLEPVIVYNYGLFDYNGYTGALMSLKYGG